MKSKKYQVYAKYLVMIKRLKYNHVLISEIHISIYSITSDEILSRGVINYANDGIITIKISIPQ